MQRRFMMDFLSRMTKVIDYIEEHITEDFDYSEVAKIVCCDVYQFGRIFSYVVGISLSEYIRNRRLSCAAIDLQIDKAKVVDIALKYGYTSPESFSRAFRQMHGLSPKDARSLGVELRLYPRITFYITVKGDVDMEYRIEQKGVIKGVGITKNFGKWTANSEAANWKDQMNELWLFWEYFLNHGKNQIIRDQYNLYREPFWQIGVTHTLDNGDTVLSIGAEDAGGDYPELTPFEIPASTWVVFKAKGALNQNNHPIGALTTKIYGEWLPSSGYVKSMNYTLEIYGPGDTTSDDYICEIWIPIKKNK